MLKTRSYKRHTKNGRVTYRTSRRNPPLTLIERLRKSILQLVSFILLFLVTIISIDIVIQTVCHLASINYENYYFAKRSIEIVIILIIGLWNNSLIRTIIIWLIFVYTFTYFWLPKPTQRSKHVQPVQTSLKPIKSKEPVFFNSKWKTILLDDCGRCGYRSYKFVYNFKWKKIVCPVCGTVQEGF